MTPLLNVRQVADQLGVSRATVLRWTARGDLPGFRLPSGALRYRAEDLEDWLGRRSTQEVGSHLAEAPPVR
jgi:excisionase family DNA binding protein